MDVNKMTEQKKEKEIEIKEFKEKISIVKPLIWNFKLQDGKDAWEKVPYSSYMSGVPRKIGEKEVFDMIVNNDYGSALEHINIEFDIRMSKGNAPELLEHRLASHSGHSTRYIKTEHEMIMPWDLLKLEEDNPRVVLFLTAMKNSVNIYENLLKIGVKRETARYSLSFAHAAGKYHYTINLRSLMNLLSMRLCVRSSPEFRCIAAQLYFNLVKEMPIIRGMVGCRGFLRGACPESNVTGVRKGKQLSGYHPCPFKNSNTNIYIPTKSQLRDGLTVQKFNLDLAAKLQEKIFKKWASWSG